MKDRILFGLAAATLVTLSTALPQSALAGENGHAYNGSYCKNYFGSQVGDFNYQTNGIRNLSSSTRYINCPVLVDEIANTSGTTRVWLHYTGNGTVRCTLQSKNGNGTTKQSRSGSRPGTGWFQIPNITADDFWGSYVMYCSLPAAGILNTIWLGENN